MTRREALAQRLYKEAYEAGIASVRDAIEWVLRDAVRVTGTASVGGTPYHFGQFSLDKDTHEGWVIALREVKPPLRPATKAEIVAALRGLDPHPSSLAAMLVERIEQAGVE